MKMLHNRTGFCDFYAFLDKGARNHYFYERGDSFKKVENQCTRQ